MALLRRTGLAVVDNTATVVAGDLLRDEDTRDVTRGGHVISLT